MAHQYMPKIFHDLPPQKLSAPPRPPPPPTPPSPRTNLMYGLLLSSDLYFAHSASC